MGKLSTVFGILTAIMAVIAVTLSFLLFTRRNEFRGRADHLATAVATIVKTSDPDNSTNVSHDASFTPADRASGTPESGTLGWKAYHEAKDATGDYAAYQKCLDKAVGLVQTATVQRNALAESLTTVASELGMPEAEAAGGNLKNLGERDKFAQSNDRVLQLTRAVVVRDNAMIRTYVTCGKAVDFEFDEKQFTERQNMTDEDGNESEGEFPTKVPLAEFANKVTMVKTRCNDYVETIVDGMERVAKHKWETDSTQLADDREYAGALTSLLNDFEDINEQLVLFDKAKLEVTEYKLKMEEMVDELELTRKEWTKVQDDLAKKKVEVQRLRAQLNLDTGMDVGVGPVEMSQNLEGKVVQVNKEWNFVILDLGRNRIRENVKMLVARNDDLIARVEISKVMRNISIAEVLPEGEAGQVKVGDRVILPFVKPAPAGR